MNAPGRANAAVAWVDGFRAAHGRAPRVLHIGNIANNAYLNAKILRRAGIESDVLCYDYYHIMGCPEWEDAEFDARGIDHFKPDWAAIDLHGFKRPAWFAQGPLSLCVKYLERTRSGNSREAAELSARLSAASGLADSDSGGATTVALSSKLARAAGFVRRLVRLLAFDPLLLRKVADKLDYWTSSTSLARRLAADCVAGLMIGSAALLRLVVLPPAVLFGYRLGGGDTAPFDPYIPEMRQLFAQYDIVVGYATDGLFPMLAGVPYVAYEHGTIRNVPFQDTPQGRVCARTYREAGWVCITNADNVVAAEKLGLKRYSFMPHPVNEDVAPETTSVDVLRAELRNSHQADFILFHPSRHHWSAERHPDWEKGNDLFIRGFAEFRRRKSVRGLLVLVSWGHKVRESRALIGELGIEDCVHWVDPLPGRRLIEYILASDAVADQISVGAFGSVFAKALMCGRPVLGWVREDLHRWCFEKLPPMMNVWTEEMVIESLERLHENPQLRTQLSIDGREWYTKYHSNAVITTRLVEVFQGIEALRSKLAVPRAEA